MDCVALCVAIVGGWGVCHSLVLIFFTAPSSLLERMALVQFSLVSESISVRSE